MTALEHLIVCVYVSVCVCPWTDGPVQAQPATLSAPADGTCRVGASRSSISTAATITGDSQWNTEMSLLLVEGWH